MGEFMQSNTAEDIQRERELIRKAKNGDTESFESLILACKEKAYNIALRYLKNEEDALDVLQDSFIRIYRHLSKFNEQSRFDTWVYRIVVNTCNDMLRKNKKITYLDQVYKNEDDEDIVVEIADNSAGPEEILEKQEESSYILECLNKLQDPHREIVVLRDINGFSYEEIAEMLDCSIGTVKSKIARARHKFKEIYLGRAK
jgi:RNA polymerase sigma-70 factor (ECF subfamily)